MKIAGLGHLKLALAAGLLLIALAGCRTDPTSVAPGLAVESPAAPIDLPAMCRGDGAVQTWLLLPFDPPQTELMAAYLAGQVVEFQGRVLYQDDDPARLPHRRYLLAEAAEGITLTLDYQGDPPPLAFNQSYRLVSWADQALIPTASADSASSPGATPGARSYGLQVFDEAGLLFLGLTNTDMSGDPLNLELIDVAGDCPVTPASGNPCVAGRQVQPLEVRWGDDAIRLYPGEDGQLQHAGALYAVSLYRNRRLELPETACAGYFEVTRSLRIERIDPPPAAPPTPTLTGTLTTTLPLSDTLPLTATPP